MSLLEVNTDTNLLAWFLQPDHENVRCLNAQEIAASLAALLRWNRSRDFENPNFGRVVQQLYQLAEAFRSIWDRYKVDSPGLFPIELEDSQLSRKSFRGLLLRHAATAAQFVLLMTPYDGDPLPIDHRAHQDLF